MHKALYRKYRPNDFDNVVGQNVIIETLMNELNKKCLNHAYLFSGPRGTGKTTVAKILAKTVNCLNLNNGNPCNNCENCNNINNLNSIDIIEIDAASNNGVDQIRELKDGINLIPTSLNYKVYIIDEVHMLSIGAFNALLKTLEEPPTHVIFILATTEFSKVPVTIVSRCQCFDFKKIATNDIVNRLKYIINIEQLSIDDNVIEAIADLSNGGMRDALTILEKTISFSGDVITLERFFEINGIVSEKKINKMVDLLLKGNTTELLNQLEKELTDDKDVIVFVNNFISYLKEIVLKYYLNKNDNNYNIDNITNLIILLSNSIFDLKNAINSKILLEMLLIKFINDVINIKNNKKDDLEIISREIISNDKANKKNANKTIKNEENSEISDDNAIKISQEDIQLKEIRINNTFFKASKELLHKYRDLWNELNQYTFDLKIGYIVCLLLEGTLCVASDENIVVSFAHESLVIKAMDNYDKIIDTVGFLLKINCNFVFLTNEEWEQNRKKFIENKKNNIEYKYINEPIVDNKVNNTDEYDIIKEAKNFFGADIIEIK